MATIKEVISEFCARSNLPIFSSYVGVNQPSQLQYLSLLRQIGDDLRNRPYNWSCLKRPYYFNTQTGVSKYQLPGDFYRMLDSSQWDVTNQMPMNGPISDAQMAYRQVVAINLTNRKGYNLVGPTEYLFNTSPYQQRSAGTFQLDQPGANNTDQVFLNYVSCNWLWPQDWAATTAYVVGDIRAGNGNIYYCTVSGTSGTTRPSATSGNITDGTVTWVLYREPYLLSASQNTNLSDNDRVLFDMDLMVEGLKYAYLNAKKLPADAERAAWDQTIKNAYTRNEAPVRSSLADQAFTNTDWPMTPVGSWPV